MLNILAVSGYRSLRDLVMPLDRLNLVTGPNGSGKSNLYRALRLLAETAQGRVIPSLAREGGLQSTLWAGPETFSRAVLRGDQPVQGETARIARPERTGDEPASGPASGARTAHRRDRRTCPGAGRVAR